MSVNKSAGNIFFGVFAIATIRDFLEMALEGRILLSVEDPLYSLKNYFLHFNSFYFLVYISMSLVLYMFTLKKVSISECLKIGALAMTLIWVGPLFDYFAFGSFDMFYPRDPLNVVCNLHHIADPDYNYEGMSKGMRLEILFAGMAGCGYIFYKSKHIIKSLCGGLCLSITCISIGLLIPFITQYYEYGFNFGYHKLYDSVLLHQGFVIHGAGCKIALFYQFLCLILFSVVYFLRSPQNFLAIVKNFRWTRSVHYLLLFFAGTTFIYFNPPIPDSSYAGLFEYMTTIWNHPSDLFGIFMAGLAVFLSFQSAVVFNDIYDYDIDIVSNLDRPLVTKAIPLSEYFFIGKLFALLALTISLCISETFFFFVLLYNLLAFLYSSPPFRLRKYFLVSNLILATIFLLTFHAGATVLIPDYRFEIIPSNITFGLLIGYALALTVKDSKDYEGDKASCVQTLHTLFGKKTGDILSVILVCFATILTPILLHLNQFLFFSIFICFLFLLIIIVIKRKNLKELFIIVLYYIFMMFVLFSLCSSSQHRFLAHMT